jgi:hypothetical protein
VIPVSEAVVAELGGDAGCRGAPADHRISVCLRQHRGCDIDPDMPFSSSGRDHTLINAACIFLTRSSYNRNRLTLSARHATARGTTLLGECFATDRPKKTVTNGTGVIRDGRTT